MAEGLLNSIYGEYFEAYSAGTDPDILNPCAVKVMADRGYRYILEPIQKPEGI